MDKLNSTCTQHTCTQPRLDVDGAHQAILRHAEGHLHEGRLADLGQHVAVGVALHLLQQAVLPRSGRLGVRGVERYKLNFVKANFETGFSSL